MHSLPISIRGSQVAVLVRLGMLEIGGRGEPSTNLTTIRPGLGFAATEASAEKLPRCRRQNAAQLVSPCIALVEWPASYMPFHEPPFST